VVPALTWHSACAVRKITIDISPLCDRDCDHDREWETRGFIDILPLLRLKWFFPSVEVSLTQTDRHIDSRVHYWEDDNRLVIDVHLLEDLAEAIGTMDLLDLKRHGKFDRLIENVLVKRELDEGRVTYSSTRRAMYYRPENEFVVPFFIEHDPNRSLELLVLV
jgi:hypothetical protein